MSLLTTQDLSVTRRGRAILQGVSLTVDPGEVVGLIGPNGAGKTTLMRAALGLIPSHGQSSLAAMPPRARAKTAAWLPQARELAWPIDVETAITLGRLPHLTMGQKPGEVDRDAVARAMDDMALSHLRARPVTELSGGEQARVLIARTLAQETPLIMADEPIAGLDPAHQIAAMKIFSSLAESGKAVLVSIHDLGLAARHCTRLVLMDAGRAVADGTAADVLSPSNLREHFNISAHFTMGPDGPLFQPLEVLS